MLVRMTRIALVAVLAVSLTGCLFHSRKPQPNVPSSVAAPDASKVAIYVFTTPPADFRLPTLDERSRTEATSELKNRLRGKKDLAVVDARQQADVVVQLISPVQLFTPLKPTNFDDRQFIADIAAAGKTVRLSAARGDEGRTIYSLAKSIDKWVKANRAGIVGARPK